MADVPVGMSGVRHALDLDGATEEKGLSGQEADVRV
jgi:hypothetical protein